MIENISNHCHIVCPAMLGRFAEDGGLLELFDSQGLPYWGCNSSITRLVANKISFKNKIQELGYPVLNYLHLTPHDNALDKMNEWLHDHGYTTDMRYVVSKACFQYG